MNLVRPDRERPRAPEAADFRRLDAALRSNKPSFGFSDGEWLKVRGAHLGFLPGT